MNQHDSLIKLWTQTANLIKAKLGTSPFLPPSFGQHSTDLIIDEAVHLASIGRMNYASFKDAITDRYSIVCEGWPLQDFVSPSAIKSRLSVEILHAAWTNGTTRFRRLTPEELRTHREPQAEKLRQAAICAATTAATASISAGLTAQPVVLEATQAQSGVIDPALLDSAHLDPASMLLVSATMMPIMSETTAESSQGAEQIFNITTSALVPVHKCKTRSDKGTIRAPYKKKNKAPELLAA